MYVYTGKGQTKDPDRTKNHQNKESRTPEGSDGKEENKEKKNSPHKKTSENLRQEHYCTCKFKVLNNFIFFIIKCNHNFKTFSNNNILYVYTGKDRTKNPNTSTNQNCNQDIRQSTFNASSLGK